MRIFFRKLLIISACAAFFIPALGQSDADPVEVITSHRKKQEDEMRSETSPLPAKERKKFKGLKYYPINLDYRLKAQFIRTEGADLFKMKTTKAYRSPEYKKFGEVHFTLHGNKHVLEVYQNPELSKRDGYADYLFIPFTDETNGEETYEVGRYLEMRIPEGNEVTLDFNLCYNPYCSYSPNYACPIPPAVNHLPIKIEAGEKKYKKH